VEDSLPLDTLGQISHPVELGSKVIEVSVTCHCILNGVLKSLYDLCLVKA